MGNMFGSKWKVLMSACPDCCIDELKRIQLVEENRRKLRNRPSGQRRSSSKVRSQNSAGSPSVHSSAYSSSCRGSKTPMVLTPPQPWSSVKGDSKSDMDTA